MEKEHIKNKYKMVACKYGALVEDRFDGLWDGIINQLNISEKDYILDLGCGTGKTINRIMSKYPQYKLNLDGIDLCPEMISEAEKRNMEETDIKGHRVSFWTQDCIEFLKAEKDKYTLVIASFILNFVEASKLFPLVNNALKEGGKFLILTTALDALKEVERDFFRFAISHPFYFNWWALLTKKMRLQLPVEKIVKILFEAKFSKVEVNQPKINITFDEPLNCLKWLDEIWGETTFDLLRKDKKETVMKESLKYAETKKIKYLGEPIIRGSPFKFTLPIYNVIAGK